MPLIAVEQGWRSRETHPHRNEWGDGERMRCSEKKKQKNVETAARAGEWVFEERVEKKKKIQKVRQRVMEREEGKEEMGRGQH